MALVSYRALALQDDPDLRDGELAMESVTAPDGRRIETPSPMKWPGGFAVVYRIQAKDGSRYALRLFTKATSETAERYEEIVKFLMQAQLPFIVTPEFQGGSSINKGIFVEGNRYPYVKMPWIDGDPLNKWIEEQSQRDDRSAIASVSEEWVELALQLSQAGIAHGDLQCGNILVDSSGCIRLIDLDGMYVPSLAGKESVGAGFPSFQHPKRSASAFDRHLDDFSAIAIALSLKALALDPSLLHRQPERLAENDLLFSANDIANPSASTLFSELLRSSDAEIVRLTQVLATAAQGVYQDVPCVEEILDPRGRLERSFATLTHALNANDDEEIVKVWADAGAFHGYAPAADRRLLQKIARAHARVNAKANLLAAVQTDDDEAVVRAGGELERLRGLHLLSRQQIHYYRELEIRLQALHELRLAFDKGDVEIARAWRPELLDYGRLTARERIRVSTALRTLDMPEHMRAALADDDASAAAAAYDSFLSSRIGGFLEDDSARIKDLLARFEQQRQRWLETLSS